MHNIQGQIKMLERDVIGLEKDKQMVMQRLRKLTDEQTGANTVNSQNTQPGNNYMLVIKVKVYFMLRCFLREF